MVSKEELRNMSRNLTADPDDYMSSLRKNIFMYLEHKNITLAEVAELADIPVSTLRTFLYGGSRDCHFSSIVRLARVFEISIDELAGTGTISPQTCASLQTVRQLPESLTHFVRWMINYHYENLTSKKVSERAVEVMQPAFGENGNLKNTNVFEIKDISGIGSTFVPKVFMGIKLPGDEYAPFYFQGDVLLLANDRNSRPEEHVVVVKDDNLWILKRKVEIIDGEKMINYYSIRDGGVRCTVHDEPYIIGYVAKVLHE